MVVVGRRSSESNDDGASRRPKRRSDPMLLPSTPDVSYCLLGSRPTTVSSARSLPLRDEPLLGLWPRRGLDHIVSTARESGSLSELSRERLRGLGVRWRERADDLRRATAGGGGDGGGTTRISADGGRENEDDAEKVEEANEGGDSEFIESIMSSMVEDETTKGERGGVGSVGGPSPQRGDRGTGSVSADLAARMGRIL